MSWLDVYIKFKRCFGLNRGGGEPDLERGYGDMWPWRTHFHASPVVHKGPISSKSVSSQDPLWENWEILASTALIFAQILASKPPNLEIFSSQAPSFRGKYHFAAPHFGNLGRTPLPEKKKKLSAPLPRSRESLLHMD